MVLEQAGERLGSDPSLRGLSDPFSPSGMHSQLEQLLKN